ncbi:MAG: hypothetical protein ACON5H_11630 [Akkermansiaceae bacterium]
MSFFKDDWEVSSKLLGLALAAGWLGSCAENGGGDVSVVPSAPAIVLEAMGDGAETKRSRAVFSENRPGIATGWGHNVRSTMGYTEFNRNTKTSGTAIIRYNDAKGAKAMGVGTNRWNPSGMQTAVNGLVSWGVKSRGWLLKNQKWRNERFVTGTHGRTYSLLVKNLAESRLEIVLTVDGLDVMDGKTGSLKKRGYIVSPGKTLEVKGFRRSTDTVAAFKFSTVRDSYANQRHGDTRNVGVIGMAVFTEKGVNPWKEQVARRTARAFAEEPLYRARTTTD